MGKPTYISLNSSFAIFLGALVGCTPLVLRPKQSSGWAEDRNPSNSFRPQESGKSKQPITDDKSGSLTKLPTNPGNQANPGNQEPPLLEGTKSEPPKSEPPKYEPPKKFLPLVEEQTRRLPVIPPMNQSLVKKEGISETDNWKNRQASAKETEEPPTIIQANHKTKPIEDPNRSLLAPPPYPDPNQKMMVGPNGTLQQCPPEVCGTKPPNNGPLASANPHIRNAPTVTGVLLNLGPNEQATERAIELANKLQACEFEKQVLMAKAEKLEAEIANRNRLLDESAKEIDQAVSEVTRARSEMQALRKEIEALRQKNRDLEKEDLETLRAIISALEKLLEGGSPKKN